MSRLSPFGAMSSRALDAFFSPAVLDADFWVAADLLADLVMEEFFVALTALVGMFLLPIGVSPSVGGTIWRRTLNRAPLTQREKPKKLSAERSVSSHLSDVLTRNSHPSRPARRVDSGR